MAFHVAEHRISKQGDSTGIKKWRGGEGTPRVLRPAPRAFACGSTNAQSWILIFKILKLAATIGWGLRRHGQQKSQTKRLPTVDMECCSLFDVCSVWEKAEEEKQIWVISLYQNHYFENWKTNESQDQIVTFSSGVSMVIIIIRLITLDILAL